MLIGSKMLEGYQNTKHTNVFGLFNLATRLAEKSLKTCVFVVFVCLYCDVCVLYASICPNVCLHYTRVVSKKRQDSSEKRSQPRQKSLQEEHSSISCYSFVDGRWFSFNARGSVSSGSCRVQKSSLEGVAI